MEQMREREEPETNIDSITDTITIGLGTGEIASSLLLNLYVFFNLLSTMISILLLPVTITLIDGILIIV